MHTSLDNKSFALGFVFIFCFCGRSTFADDWPQWLGAKGDSVWKETGIVETFPEGGPVLKWKQPIAGGYSGPSVANGKVYVMDWVADPIEGKPKNLNGENIPRNQNFVRELHPGTERVLCLNIKDGSTLWKHEYACHYTSVATYAIGPRCTPTVDNEKVYTLGAEGDLLCLDANTGKKIWSKSFVRDFGMKVAEWGVASHPVVDGNKLICVVGGKKDDKEFGVVAFDKNTGDVLWSGAKMQKPGYCTPVIYDFSGSRQLIVWHSDSVDALDPETGKLIWSVPFKSTFAMSIGVPRREGNRLFVMCFAGMCAAIDVADDGRNAQLAWKGNRNKGMDGVMNTPFILDGHIYGCGNGGRYVCAKLADGKQLWTTFEPASAKRPIQWGNVFTVRHRDRYFLANDKGELIIARMSPTGYDEVSKAKLIEPTHKVGSRVLVWSHPAFANQCVYLRNDKEIRCYSLAK